eukprot:521948_1
MSVKTMSVKTMSAKTVFILFGILIYIYSQIMRNINVIYGMSDILYIQDDEVDQLNFSECISLTNESAMHFVSEYELENNMRFEYPTYLFSYGGSGNTLTRLVIETLTNIYTGGMYHDQKDVFKGGGHCKERDVIVVKLHPEHIRSQRENKDNYLKPCFSKRIMLTQTPKNWEYISAIFIVRNPFKAIFTMFEFFKGTEKIAGYGANDRHVRHFMANDFKVEMFKYFVQSQITSWMDTFVLIELMEKYNYTNYTVVKFENLVNFKQPKIAIIEMNKIVRFVYNDKYYTESSRIMLHKMQCIITHFMPTNYGRFGTYHRSKSNSSEYLSADMAYYELAVFDIDFICNLWTNIKQVLFKFHYNMLSAINCTERTVAHTLSE